MGYLIRVIWSYDSYDKTLKLRIAIWASSPWMDIETCQAANLRSVASAKLTVLTVSCLRVDDCLWVPFSWPFWGIKKRMVNETYTFLMKLCSSFCDNCSPDIRWQIHLRSPICWLLWVLSEFLNRIVSQEQTLRVASKHSRTVLQQN